MKTVRNGFFTSKYICLTLILGTFILGSCAPSSAVDRAPSSSQPKEYAAERLRTKGVSEDFVQLLLSNYREEERSKVLDLNLLGFMRSRPITGTEKIPYWELRRVKEFLNAHRKAFKLAEKKYHVSKEVIASLLWVETKFGRDIGTYHVGSAYFSLAQADYPTIVDQTIERARAIGEVDTMVEQKIIERSKTKSEWAVNELVALEKIHSKSAKDASRLNGSFSGAFGLAQFLPSSYLTWAKGTKGNPNLFRADDAILSVANYLASNGWQKEVREGQEAALFHYNRDRTYVNRILHMSQCIKKIKSFEKKKRNVASQSC